ncbi:MAG: O-antigen ligase family protein [Anaerolineae bacterium]|nr:O-antigen ligase family protein [Anaerolineae bacterium]
MPLHISKKKIAALFSALALFVMMRPLQRLFVIGRIDTQLIVIAFFVGIVGIYVVLNFSHFLYIVLLDKLLLFLIVLVPFSILWSVAPAKTLSGSITFLAGSLFGIYLAMRFSMREQLLIVAAALAIAAIASLIVSLLLPAVGTGIARGVVEVWSGVFRQKNGLGRYMTIGAVVFFLLWLEHKRRWWAIILFMLATGLILLASSATAFVTLLLTVVLVFFYRQMLERGIARRLFPVAVISLLVSLIVVVIVSENSRTLELLLVALGRDPERNSLLVRQALWQYVGDYIRNRPILGYGFDAFWQSGESRIIYVYNNTQGWETNHAHNGFLELWLQLGLVGLVAMIVHILTNFRRAIVAAQTMQPGTTLWILSYLTILLIFNFTYSALLGQLTVPWTLYVSTTLSLRLHQQRVKYQARTLRPALTSTATS